MTPRTKGLLLGVLASVALSTAPTAIKWGFAAGLGPVPQLALRLAVGAALLWAVLGAFNRDKVRIDRAGLFACAVAGAANALSLGAFYLAVELIDASLAIMVFSAFPAVTLGLLLLRGERPTRLSWARLALALLGVYLLVGPGGQVHSLGLALVGGTAVFYAFHLTWIQWRLGGYAARTVALYVVSFMALFVGLAALVSGRLPPALNPTGWFVVLWTGAVATALARLAMFAAVRAVGSGQTALLGPLETVLAVAWAALLLGERLAPWQLAGAGLVLASAGLAALRSRRKTPRGILH